MKILLQRTQDGCVIDDIRRFRTLINSMYNGFTVIAVSVLEFTNCNWMMMFCRTILIKEMNKQNDGKALSDEYPQIIFFWFALSVNLIPKACLQNMHIPVL
ncbi:hypothetical protein T12_3938 [Trichinella patagoniensis]|uniref:Uncharacterized protein n=1 Tax=Trichinella patagoniensis TaxID=990121 RepID=A0A0V0ZNN6_9BILA|nr:hypothetical protein T12_3938 [Trichinella patagoniensis]